MAVFEVQDYVYETGMLFNECMSVLGMRLQAVSCYHKTKRAISCIQHNKPSIHIFVLIRVFRIQPRGAIQKIPI